MSLLNCHELTVKFGGLVAVNNVSMYVNEGEIVSIVGPNGAGKTTLFNILTGYLPPSSGDVTFNGVRVTNRPSFELARMGMVRTFQKSELFIQCTVLENLLIGQHLLCGGGEPVRSLLGSAVSTPSRRKAESEALTRAKEILKFIGIPPDRRDVQARSLPHGEQRLLGIAIALSAKPKLLLMDEPVGGMTATEANRVIDLVYEVRSKGITVLLIEHNMRIVMKISDRVVVLNQGQKIAEGLPSEVQADNGVIEAYLGKWR